LVGASLMIHFWHWLWMDAAMSLVIACLTGLAAIPLIRESLEVVLEFSPRSLDPAQVKAAIAAFEPVLQVETLHIWTIDTNQIMLSAHLVVSSQLTATARDQLIHQIQTHLGQEFGIHAATLQLLSRHSLNNLILHPLLHRSLTDYVLQKT
jgi:cobalt-zinc-cadmium efflux system protein